ncbi:hypothetical protein [Streptomyces sp. BF23-19]|uniref:hypothetical protein n=1 Tax=unclassified Streptomyces TaxID=2593676 RepID=UPI0034E5041F
MDIATILTAAGASAVAATTATRAALRTSGMTWRAAHSKNVFEALKELNRASNPDRGSVQEILRATDDVRISVTGPLRVLAERVIEAGSDYHGTRERLGEIRHPYTILRRQLKERVRAIELMQKDPQEFDKLDDSDFALLGAYQMLRCYRQEEREGGHPDPEPIRKALLDSLAYSESAVDLLLISAERQRRIASEQGRKNNMLHVGREELTTARDALQAAVVAWGENPPRRRRSKAGLVEQRPRRRWLWRQRRQAKREVTARQMGRAA